jgi:hypothetical protein
MSQSKIEFSNQQMAYLIKKAAEGDAQQELMLTIGRTTQPSKGHNLTSLNSLVSNTATQDDLLNRKLKKTIVKQRAGKKQNQLLKTVGSVEYQTINPMTQADIIFQHNHNSVSPTGRSQIMRPMHLDSIAQYSSASMPSTIKHSSTPHLN